MFHAKQTWKHAMNFTPEMDARIVELYTPPYILGAISTQAQIWQCRTDKLTKRARQLGLKPISNKNPVRRWTAPEIILLRKMPHLTHEEASRALRRAGYRRTPDAVDGFRFRDGWRMKVERDETIVGYTAEGLAHILNVDPRTVQRWIRLKFLKAAKEGGNDETRVAYYRIQPKNIQDFLKESIHYIDLSKIDKYWLIDILTTRF
jgi:hypothetical protein